MVQEAFAADSNGCAAGFRSLAAVWTSSSTLPGAKFAYQFGDAGRRLRWCTCARASRSASTTSLRGLSLVASPQEFVIGFVGGIQALAASYAPGAGTTSRPVSSPGAITEQQPHNALSQEDVLARQHVMGSVQRRGRVPDDGQVGRDASASSCCSSRDDSRL
ncbi:hypothetical protein EXE59_13125 [Nocardioides eburneiflavus]|uniref:Uncharacterized protein n=1 Tax=Nocardioides eburneiflavus TaxID=2518372 RepID=A0A4Z1CF93_9ACTN|nr:hypothetical protein [Nocardioides eburneiflavus]TGN64795.1 hypothetical protein EXE59_13125 [Nocardioides eburneiflavus]